MRKAFLIAAVVLLAAGLCHAQIELTDETTVVFATVDQGRVILTARDEHIRNLSPFDRTSRMKTARDVSEETFLEFVGENVVAWTDTERQTIASRFETFRPQIAALNPSFPATIYLIKTTGNEEGGAAYTRDSAVVLPAGMLRGFGGVSARLICHELFHILSRQNPQLQDRLYEVIGFKKCNGIEWPAPLARRRLTNPDAPTNEHYIEVKVDGEPVLAVPVLFSRTETYDVERGGDFFDYLEFRFLLCQRQPDSPKLKVLCDGNDPRLVETSRLEGFWEQIGRNTQYIYHPEEILADNFTLLVMPRPNVPSPEIIEKMKQMLSEEPPAATVAP